MSDSLKNIGVFIICLSLVGVGYFMISGSSDAVDLSTPEKEELLNKTQSFIEKSNQLSSITIDTSVFDDSRFDSLRDYSTNIPDQPVGKDNLFSPAVSVEAVVAASID